MNKEEIFKAALALPHSDQIEVANILFASASAALNPSPELESLLDKRLAEARKSPDVGPVDEVHAEIRERLAVNHTLDS